MKDKIKVLYKQPGKTMCRKTVPNTLKACQELVDGFIETIRISPDLVLVCNEEGKLRGLEPNPFPRMHDLVGSWFICGTYRGEFTSVPAEYVWIMKQYFTIQEEDEDAEEK